DETTRLHFDCRYHAGAGHRREHGDLSTARYRATAQLADRPAARARRNSDCGWKWRHGALPRNIRRYYETNVGSGATRAAGLFRVGGMEPVRAEAWQWQRAEAGKGSRGKRRVLSRSPSNALAWQVVPAGR